MHLDPLSSRIQEVIPLQVNTTSPKQETRSGPPPSIDRAEISDQARELAVAETQLSEEERQEVREMKQRDEEVRRHEQAHVSAAGPYTLGGPAFQTEKGPDGNEYAVSGDVHIDTSEINGDPEGTIQKMQTVQRAALAPADPSAQDRKIAAEAVQKESKAETELASGNVSSHEDNPMFNDLMTYARNGFPEKPSSTFTIFA